MCKLRGGSFSQCIPISYHHIVQFQHLTILLVNYTSIKQKNIDKSILLIKGEKL